MTNLFLDNAATTCTDPQVVEKMLPFFSDNFGNPSGIHYFSLKAKKALDKARETVAEILNCKFEEIIFTGGGTESDNLAIFGITDPEIINKKNKHIITSKIEHHAVLHCFEKLKKNGWETNFLSPTREGEITEEIFLKNIKDNTYFASIMMANNEIGTINDISKLAKIAKEKNIIFHSDACQAGSVANLDVKKLQIDLLTLNGSKIYGPKGVGLLYKKQDLKIQPQIIGGSQEFGLRAGTENVPGIIGFAEALRIASKKREEENKRLKNLQDKIINFVLSEIPLVRLNGHASKRLPSNINFSFLNTEGESLLLFLDGKGFSVATGSACSSGSLDPSHVLLGIGLPHFVSHGSLRISLGRFTSAEDVDKFLAVLPNIIDRVRGMSALQMKAEDFEGWF